jgi:predicted pyridoxine 5'-phosphate oxidase superfamily flavin-nucleotide-binding protein
VRWLANVTAMDAFYQPGHRSLQDQFDSRRLADRLSEKTLSSTLDDRAHSIVETAPFFWLATADTEGWPDVSYKGGRPGFVRILDKGRLAFPSYDGNGMYRSLGNIIDNPKVGMLFCDFEDAWRIRVRGTARVVDDASFVEQWAGAELAVEVTIDTVFPNCNRYIHKMSVDEISPHAPADGYEPPDAEWKSMEIFEKVLPRKE